MSTTAILVYTAFLGGASAAEIITLMGAVPPPAAELSFLGVRVLSDITAGAGPVLRTLTLGLTPGLDAAATAVLETSASGSPIGSVAVTTPGADYVLPPIISFTGGRPSVVPEQSTVGINVNQRAGSLDSPALAQAYLKVVSTAVFAGGGGYGPNTFIKLSGGIKPGGVQAVLTPTIAGGIITGVVLTSPGSGYTGVPTVIVVDPGLVPGVGGVVSVSMGVGEIKVERGGTGFNAPPVVVITPYFQALFPPTSDQAAPFKQLMTTALEQATMGPVTASLPIIA
jgi:hypothetical protein